MTELPFPCKHTKRVYRVSSHADDEDMSSSAHCSVWVCDRPECIDNGKRYVAFYTLARPKVIDGKTREVVAS